MTLIESLRNKYAKITDDGTIGGEHPLKEISDICLDICKISEGSTRVLSFVLYEIFYNLSWDQRDRPVLVEECTKLYNQLNRPVLEAIEALEKEEIPISVISNLIEAFLNE